jgi:hypothetical protein
MEKILSKRHYRTSFFIIVFLLITLVLVVRYYAIPYYDPSLKTTLPSFAAELLSKFFTSLVVTVFIGSFVFWLTPKVMNSSKMDIIEPKEIGSEIKQGLSKTSYWWYQGGCGRFLSAVTIPEMAKNARKDSKSKNMNILIIDPENIPLCEEYSTYRKSLDSASKDSESWSLERVRFELFCTIVRILSVKHESPMLIIQFGLIKSFSTFRIDMSSKQVIITKEDKTAPAMMCQSDTYFYDAYKDEMVMAMRQARKLKDVDWKHSIDSITEGDLKSYFNQLGLNFTETSKYSYKSMLESLRKRPNPYG